MGKITFTEEDGFTEDLGEVDPTFSWIPTFKQEQFLTTPLTVKEGFYAGAVNAGKSDCLIMYPIVHGWHEMKGFKGLFLRRTMPELRNEIIPRARDMFRNYGAKFNKTDSCFTFPSGALFFFSHVESEDDVHNFDSMQPQYVAFDELTSFTEWQYLYITIERVRRTKQAKALGLPAIVRSASNPGNSGHAWVYKRFIKPFPEGHKILEGKGGLKRIYIPATIEDNPYADPVYKQELDALPEAERRAKKLGDWTAFEGSCFTEFRKQHYPGEPDNACHVVDEFDVPDWWPKIVAIDWGFRAMTWVGYGAISPQRKLYVYREQSFVGEKIEVWAPKVKQYIDKENPGDIVICHSANQNRGEPHTILELVSDALNRTLRLGEKNRLSGKQLLHEYLRWKQIIIPLDEIPIYNEEHAAWILRNRGLEEYKSYMGSLNRNLAMENIPRLLFFKSCKLVIEAISVAQYEKNKVDGKMAEDVAEWPGDDPYDGLRMLLHSADNFFGESKELADKMDKREVIVKQLEVTGDMTAFYRNAKRLESEGEALYDMPVSRFHRRIH
jgi:hypothetical protein